MFREYLQKAKGYSRKMDPVTSVLSSITPGVGAAVSGGLGLVGSILGSNASKDAANTQANAANRASDLQMQQFQQMQQNLAPYMQLGASTIPQLQQLLGGSRLNTPFSFNPTMEQLEQTPGYQFTLQQGNKALDNAMAAKGLSLSGAQLKGLDAYNTGLASNTFQQQYQNALQNFNTNYGQAADQYNRLSSLVGLGENASAGVGNAGLQTASNIGNNITGGANALAAGQIGSANALSGGLSSLGTGGLLYSLLKGNNPASGGVYFDQAALPGLQMPAMNPMGSINIGG
jgi:hypothetical protein